MNTNGPGRTRPAPSAEERFVFWAKTIIFDGKTTALDTANKRRKTGLFVCTAIFALLIFTACNRQPAKTEKVREAENGETPALRIATAANAQFAMDALVQAFQEDHGIRLESMVSSSGKLMAQIEQGAPYDIFVSADTVYPNALLQRGGAVDTVRIYAYGALVLWTIKPLNMHKELALCLDPEVKKIAVANPRTAPYGQQAINLLNKYFLLDKIESKLVFGESIAQINQYVMSGACDLGFTAKSVVMSPEMKGKGDWIELSPSAYDPIAQGAVITRYGMENHPEESKAFYDFLFSEKGRRILHNYGYHLPGD